MILPELREAKASEGHGQVQQVISHAIESLECKE
jgi:hypothetical protein